MRLSVLVMVVLACAMVAVAQEDIGDIINEEPPKPIEADNWLEEVYWGFLDTIGIETPNEEQYREWKESVESRINNQDYNVSEVKLVLAEKKAVREKIVSVPIYETKLIVVPQYYWDGTKNISNGTVSVNQTMLKGYQEQTINETYVTDSWQEIVGRYDTRVVPRDRVCLDQADSILCVSVPHCLGIYTTTNVLSYVNAGCENEIIPRNSLTAIQQIATKTSTYILPPMPTKKEILASKDLALIDYVLPKAFADDVRAEAAP